MTKWKDMSYDEKAALPELALKQEIAVRKNGEMVEAFEILVQYRNMNGGKIHPSHRAVFESKLVGLFLYIKNMIIEQSTGTNQKTHFGAELVQDDAEEEDEEKMQNARHINFHPTERKLYDNLLALTNGKNDFSMKDLVSMMFYLSRKLHDLNLTDLIKREMDPMKDFYQEFM